MLVLIEIRFIFKETINNVNFQKSYIVINLFTTCRFSKTDFFFFLEKKNRFQTPVSAELQRFKRWFHIRKEKLLVYKMDLFLGHIYITRHHGRELHYLQNLVWDTGVPWQRKG